MGRVLVGVLIAALLALGVLGLVLFGGTSGFPGLDRSVIGVEALTSVLEAGGVPATRSDARLSPRLQELSLGIMPLYDMNLQAPMPDEIGPEASSLRDMDQFVFEQKLRDLPTLIILPKWRAAAASEAVAARETLIPAEGYDLLLQQMGLTGVHLHRGHGAPSYFTTRVTGLAGRITLFAPQTFDVPHVMPNCQPFLNFGPQVLVLQCFAAHGMKTHWVLSDPDILNNHGLTLDSNAAAAVALIKALGPGPQPVYLDTSLEILTAETAPERRAYQRSGTDLARFFAPPFTALWAILLILLGLFLWRGALRFGPVVPDKEDGPDQSKIAAITTRARLLRLSGHDRQMVADLVRSDLTRLSEESFGRGRAEPARLFALMARRDAVLAEEFRKLAETLMQPLDDADLPRLLSRYRSLMESLTHGPDDSRVSRPR